MSGSSIKRNTILAVRLVVSVGILAYLVTMFDWPRVGAMLARVRYAYLWPAPFLLLAAIGFAALRWRILLRRFDVDLGLRESFLYYLIGGFYGIVMPGVIGGDLVRVAWCAAARRASLAEVGLSALIERICGVLALLLIGSLAVGLLPEEVAGQLGADVTRGLVVLAAVVCTGIAMLWLGMRWLVPLASGGAVHRWRAVRLALRLLTRLHRIPLGTLAVVLILSACFQVPDIVASFCLARAIHIDVSLGVLFVIFPIVYIATVLPISLGGLGVREGVLAYLLTRLGVAPSDAVMFSFMVYLNRVVVSLTGAWAQLVCRRHRPQMPTVRDAVQAAHSEAQNQP